MSLINDALKKARQAPPRQAPSALSALPPVAEESSRLPDWLMPVLIIFLLFAAIFFIGWSVSHSDVTAIVTAPPATNAQETAVDTTPVVVPETVMPPRQSTEELPHLQGIFYSPTAPSAIVDGKTIRPGDRFLKYRVTEITAYTVTLEDADGKKVKLGMGN